MDGCLHGRQQVPGSVLGFPGENRDLRLGTFALRYILEAVDGADNVSVAIPDGLDVNERDATRAVRSLNVNLLFAHGNTGTQPSGIDRAGANCRRGETFDS